MEPYDNNPNTQYNQNENPNNNGQNYDNQYNPNGYNQQPYRQTPYGQPPYGQPYQQPGHGLAVAALVFGILAFFCCGIPFGIVAIITGVLAKEKGYKGSMATAGFILGIIAIVIACFASIYIFANPNALDGLININGIRY